MTFSFRPRSSSRRPRTAASVRTRVVSWNDAAEINDSVASDALVIPSRTGSARQRLLALYLQLLVSLRGTRLVDLLTAQVVAFTRRGNDNLAQHLANDHLDVLVIDLHALQAVDVLDLANQVISQVLNTLQAQDVVRVRLAVSDDFTPCNLLTLEHVEVAPLRNQLLMTLTRLIGNDEATLALGFLAEADRTGVLGHDRRLFRLASLEQVGNTRQTTRDIAGLRRLLRDTRNDVTHRHTSHRRPSR